MEGGQVIVYEEKDMFVTKMLALPYVEVTKQAFECSYKSFEVANTIIFPTEGLDIDCYMSRISLMIAKTMKNSGF